jgi:uncharacterized protein (TIGR02246 family)
MTNDEVIAHAAIRHVMAIYNMAGDRGQLEEVFGTFTDDAILEVPGETYRGQAEIRKFYQSAVEGWAVSTKPGRRRHFLGTSRIDLLGPDEAQGWSYFQVIRAGEIEETGIYADRFARRDGRWLIAHRRVKIEWQAGARA